MKGKSYVLGFYVKVHIFAQNNRDMREKAPVKVLAAIAECIQVIDKYQRLGEGDAEAMDEIYFLVTEAFEVARGY